MDSTFRQPHAGQGIEVAVVLTSDGSVVARDSGTVSATAVPAYSFEARGVLENGRTYELHYWIDSNIGGGTTGACDPKEIDHQWRTEFLSVANDIDWTTSHQPRLIEDVCGTFQ